MFPGRSGAGKTTLARKAPDADDVLSDEMVVIRRGEDGWRIHGTPFWGDFARGGISMRSWPLRTLAFLAQAPRDAVTMTPIMSADATLRLLGCFLSFTADRDTVKRNLALAIELGAEVRSVEASLTKNVATQQIFRKLAPHLGPEITRKVPPQSAREMVSDFRSLLRKHKTYTFRPQKASRRGCGAGWRPVIRCASRRRRSRSWRPATCCCAGRRELRLMMTRSSVSAWLRVAPRTKATEAECRKWTASRSSTRPRSSAS